MEQAAARSSISSPKSYSDHRLTIAYGWSTEDDLHFPTQGSTFQLGAGGDYGSERSPYRPLTCAVPEDLGNTADSYWTLKIGGDPSPEYRNSFDESQFLSLTYARPIALADDEVKRGRWYVEPGINVVGLQQPRETRLRRDGPQDRAGAPTRDSFGIVELYLIGTADVAPMRHRLALLVLLAWFLAPPTMAAEALR